MLSVFFSVFPANLSRRVIVRGSRLCFVLFPELNGHLASGVVFGDVKERFNPLGPSMGCCVSMD
ncbi:hypothetical protein CFBP6411_03382 [Pseudomonas syringae group genomosp. 3]|uniref:Uncharacterized protein n=2 Tax=Pseudomonas syringae group genomosp. 3 TaxID=251701 RepID=A0A2K4WFR9_9PSED|nr:hypothetical protein CFBP6411_03382 [Pseudomonas syringae group genomosp. 3]